MLSMVLILDDNSEIGAHVRSNLCYLICLKGLFTDFTRCQKPFPAQECVFPIFDSFGRAMVDFRLLRIGPISPLLL